MKNKIWLISIVSLCLLAGCSGGPGGTSGGGATDPAAIVTEEYTKKQDGSYYFTVNDPNEIDSDGKTYYCYDTNTVENGSFTYTVDLCKISGAQKGGYGVVFQRTNSSTFWVFNIDVRGYYYLAKVVSGGVNEISPTPWVYSSALKTGYGITNKITVSYLGSTNYKILANGNEVVSFTDSEYGDALRSGCFGLDTVLMPEEAFPDTPLTVSYAIETPSGMAIPQASIVRMSTARSIGAR